MQDWSDAKRLYTKAADAISKLSAACRTVKVNGLNTSNSYLVWDGVAKTMQRTAREAVLKSIPLASKNLALSQSAFELMYKLEVDVESINERVKALCLSDLAKVPYKEYLFTDEIQSVEFEEVDKKESLYKCYLYSEKLYEFIHKIFNSNRIKMAISGTKPIFLSPFFFPTRPYTPPEISLFLEGPDKINRNPLESAKVWAEYVRAVRGIWVWDKLTAEEHHNNTSNSIDKNLEKEILYVGYKNEEKILLGISNLKTEDSCWKNCADGKPDTTRSRYERIEKLINHVITTSPKPTHLLLPELSLPEKWLNTISGVLMQEKISLIVGLDYICPDKKTVYSETALILSDDRLGFSSAFQLRQPKKEPAPGEKHSLENIYGRKWSVPNSFSGKKPIYCHKGFYFGVLVCSELQSIQNRAHYQGWVDSLIVLSWNKDLETFSALVESASLDVHTYVALVNNRMYGDSRVRVPAKDGHKRDLCRLKGGENDYVAVVEIDVTSLRSFQSRAERYCAGGEQFKPVPEGFSLLPERYVTPS